MIWFWFDSAFWLLPYFPSIVVLSHSFDFIRFINSFIRKLLFFKVNIIRSFHCTSIRWSLPFGWPASAGLIAVCLSRTRTRQAHDREKGRRQTRDDTTVSGVSAKLPKHDGVIVDVQQHHGRRPLVWARFPSGKRTMRLYATDSRVQSGELGKV